MAPLPADPRTSQFVRLLAQNERRIYSYILGLVGNFADADDLQQEVSVRLWESFDQFEPGTNFGAWACTIARYQVMAFLKANKNKKVRCSQPVFEMLADQLETIVDHADERAEALERCLAEVTEANRDLLRRAYSDDESVKSIADSLGRPADTVYKSLQRTRRFLYGCIRQRMGEDGR